MVHTAKGSTDARGKSCRLAPCFVGEFVHSWLRFIDVESLIYTRVL